MTDTSTAFGRFWRRLRREARARGWRVTESEARLAWNMARGAKG